MVGEYDKINWCILYKMSLSKIAKKLLQRETQ